MKFLKKLIGLVKSEPKEAAHSCNQGISASTNRAGGLTVPRLLLDGTGPLPEVERELGQLLRRIISDSEINQLELKELSEWFGGNFQFAGDIPAIPFLWRFVQSALTNGNVESFEWSMIHAAIAKVLPEKNCLVKTLNWKTERHLPRPSRKMVQ